MDHGAQRLGVGVIAVVDDRRARDVQDFSAAAVWLQCGDGRSAGSQGHAGFEPAGNGCERIGDVVAAEQGQRDGNFFFDRVHIEAHAFAAQFFNILRAEVSSRRSAEGDDAAVEVAAELRDVAIISIQKSGALRAVQAGDQFILCARDASDTIAEIFGMGVADVGDDTPVG